MKKWLKQHQPVWVIGLTLLLIIAGVLMFLSTGKDKDNAPVLNSGTSTGMDTQKRMELESGIRAAFLEYYENGSEYKAFIRDERVVDWIIANYSENYYHRMIKEGKMHSGIREYKDTYYAGEAPEIEGMSSSEVIFDSVMDTVYCLLFIHDSLADKNGELNTGQWNIVKLGSSQQYLAELHFMVNNAEESKEATIRTDGFGNVMEVYLSGNSVPPSQVRISKEIHGPSSTLDKYLADWNAYNTFMSLFEGGDFYFAINDYSKHFTEEAKGYQALAGAIREKWNEELNVQ